MGLRVTVERMEDDEQKEVLLMSGCIEHFIEGKPKRHQKELIAVGKQLTKSMRQRVLFSLSILL